MRNLLYSTLLVGASLFHPIATSATAYAQSNISQRYLDTVASCTEALFSARECEKFDAIEDNVLFEVTYDPQKKILVLVKDRWPRGKSSSKSAQRFVDKDLDGLFDEYTFEGIFGPVTHNASDIPDLVRQLKQLEFKEGIKTVRARMLKDVVIPYYKNDPKRFKKIPDVTNY